MCMCLYALTCICVWSKYTCYIYICMVATCICISSMCDLSALTILLPLLPITPPTSPLSHSYSLSLSPPPPPPPLSVPCSPFVFKTHILRLTCCRLQPVSHSGKHSQPLWILPSEHLIILLQPEEESCMMARLEQSFRESQLFIWCSHAWNTINKSLWHVWVN